MKAPQKADDWIGIRNRNSSKETKLSCYQSTDINLKVGCLSWLQEK
jgi:hypothetical protein